MIINNTYTDFDNERYRKLLINTLCSKNYLSFSRTISLFPIKYCKKLLDFVGNYDNITLVTF